MSRFLAKVAVRRMFWQRTCSGCLEISSALTVTKMPRFFSSESHHDDYLSSVKAKTLLEGLEVTTKDFVGRTGSDASPRLNDLIEEAKMFAARDYSLANLKRIYEKVIRPELVSRALIHKYPLEHQNTQWLRYQNHHLRKKAAKFMSSYDVTDHILSLPRHDWIFFLNFLAEKRIVVIEVWVRMATIDTLVYNHGPKDFSNIHFFKGEADARHNVLAKTADLSVMLWENDQVVYAETFLAVAHCSSPIQSEAKAAFALLNVAKARGIENLLLWVDNKRVANIMSGKWQIDSDDKNWNLFMALRSLRRSFKRLIVTGVPRELMQITDDMLWEPAVMDVKKGGKSAMSDMKSAKRWSYHLNAMPLFDISMVPAVVTTISKFGKPNDGEPHSRKWYVEVQEDHKISALQNIIEALDPCQLRVAVRRVENKQRLLQEQLFSLIGNVVTAKINTWSVFAVQRTGSNPTRKRLMIVFDGFYLEKKLEEASEFVITLSKPQERSLLSAAGFQELSASAYIYYHGACSPTM